MAQAPELIAAGVKVIDLAADFRLKDQATFEKWYKIPHSAPDLLEEAVYGLPELNRDDIKKARLIANPGCYPTTMQLGFYPLLKAIADAKSGVSGAGRKAEIGTLFSEASDNFKAYGVHGHRHTPETSAQLQRYTDQKVGLIFTPHLVPMIRGMHSTLYARLTQDITNEALQALFEAQYKDAEFVDVMPFGSHPETRSTRGSNMLRIALHRPDNGNTVVILVVQDNLVKGASGQAVQCMNLMFGLPESTGLKQIALLP
jgi:N-acetyl-gamma-glutamyl-phosphate reductase